MTTVLEIITDSLQDAGILGANETPDAVDAQKAFRLLNRMLDSDSNKRLMIYNNVEEVFSLALNQQSYTIGPGGNFNTTRPVDVTACYMRDTNGNDIPVKILNYEQYAAIVSKPITASIALGMYYNSTYPLGTVYFWPVPQNTTWQAVIWSWKLLTGFTALTDSVILAPGYEQYIESKLALRLCSAYQVPVSQELKELVTESQANIKKINNITPIMGIPAILAGQNITTNFPLPPAILTGY